MVLQYTGLYIPLYISLLSPAQGDYISRLDFTDGALPSAVVQACAEIEFTLTKA